MNTVTVPDLGDGPVTIRNGGLEPFTVEAKDGKVRVDDAQLRSVLLAFPDADVTSKSRAAAQKES